MFQMCCFILIVVFLPLGIFLTAMIAGIYIESKHLKELEIREKAIRSGLVTHNRRKPIIEAPRKMEVVAGEVVIGADRFKTWLARWRQLVGGTMKSLAPVVERARREALLRAQEKAVSKGYRELANVRYCFANLKMGDQKQKDLLILVVAYGTAVA